MSPPTTFQPVPVGTQVRDVHHPPPQQLQALAGQPLPYQLPPYQYTQPWGSGSPLPYPLIPQEQVALQGDLQEILFVVTKHSAEQEFKLVTNALKEMFKLQTSPSHLIVGSESDVVLLFAVASLTV